MLLSTRIFHPKTWVPLTGGLDLSIDRGLNKMMSHIDTEMVQDTQNRMFRNDHVTVSTILTPNELDTHRPSSVLLHTLLEAV